MIVMASTPTSLKLPAELKDRVSAMAAANDQTLHAFLLEAIEKQTENEEQRQQFLAEGRAALRKARKTGEAFRLDEARSHFEARLSGKKPAALKVKRWPR